MSGASGLWLVAPTAVIATVAATVVPAVALVAPSLTPVASGAGPEFVAMATVAADGVARDRDRVAVVADVRSGGAARPGIPGVDAGRAGVRPVVSVGRRAADHEASRESQEEQCAHRGGRQGCGGMSLSLSYTMPSARVPFPRAQGCFRPSRCRLGRTAASAESADGLVPPPSPAVPSALIATPAGPEAIAVAEVRLGCRLRERHGVAAMAEPIPVLSTLGIDARGRRVGPVRGGAACRKQGGEDDEAEGAHGDDVWWEPEKRSGSPPAHLLAGPRTPRLRRSGRPRRHGRRSPSRRGRRRRRPPR